MILTGSGHDTRGATLSGEVMLAAKKKAPTIFRPVTEAETEIVTMDQPA